MFSLAFSLDMTAVSKYWGVPYVCFLPSVSYTSLHNIIFNLSQNVCVEHILNGLFLKLKNIVYYLSYNLQLVMFHKFKAVFH